ncbi:ribosome maturation factor RimP [Salisediminibacterium halotolerans]|uniref:ribosome maturation factor RimP n=1 Tax=Salisediminibacterium halotolerans TaxID=517425 RepID=UPI000EB0581C|nr:ribosome maturation factor RimP [Salisediminibacterium halotolerans]RLJ74181.1 ribosome maturation factor RimP [Actinophytocola xinjiangensis]RPE87726.1 ribosome maturation factor RimP [Salisediminibacterium halotolerans]TWG35018.1 ribosome maturation factor RimP [Salisediminibacterium halotolerans]GEL06695.1 ribosome maturation factor RimP [Salisediminibacterium halotolerans]
MSSNIPSQVEALAEPVADEMNLEVVDVEFKKEGKNWFLRVFIDGENGVDLDDCTSVSERLSEVLDQHDFIEQAYYLEVSSPGAERPLKKASDMEKAVGKNVHLTMYAPVNGEKMLEGKLTSFDGEKLLIERRVKTRSETVEVPYNKVASARLAVVF